MKKTRIFFSISSLLMSLQVMGDAELDKINSIFQRTRREEYHIDSYYIAGSNLIYDCQSEHFACVNLDSYHNCQNNRFEEAMGRKEKYSCAPLKRFDSKEECILKNYDLQTRQTLKKFCFRQLDLFEH